MPACFLYWPHLSRSSAHLFETAPATQNEIYSLFTVPGWIFTIHGLLERSEPREVIPWTHTSTGIPGPLVCFCVFVCVCVCLCVTHMVQWYAQLISVVYPCTSYIFALSCFLLWYCISLHGRAYNLTAYYSYYACMCVLRAHKRQCMSLVAVQSFLGSFLTSRPLSVLRCIILFQYN